MNLFSTFFSVLLTTYLGKHLGPKKNKIKNPSLYKAELI